MSKAKRVWDAFPELRERIADLFADVERDSPGLPGDEVRSEWATLSLASGGSLSDWVGCPTTVLNVADKLIQSV